MTYFQRYFAEIIATGILILFIVLIRYVTVLFIKRYARNIGLAENRMNLAIKYFSVFYSALTAIGIFVIWGVEPKNLFTTLSAVVTVIGVALFAQWSILSNVTSGIILLFSFPFKIGDVIRIHDKDFPIEAEIEDIRSFHTLLRTPEGEIISYPNNLLLQKGVTVVRRPEADSREFMD